VLCTSWTNKDNNNINNNNNNNNNNSLRSRCMVWLCITLQASSRPIHSHYTKILKLGILNILTWKSLFQNSLGGEVHMTPQVHDSTCSSKILWPRDGLAALRFTAERTKNTSWLMTKWKSFEKFLVIVSSITIIIHRKLICSLDS